MDINLKSKPLNNVIVLADNKDYSREFLKCLWLSTCSPYLCTTHISTKIFTFQIYGLEESDEKIFNHVKINAGLVIITTYERYSKLNEQILKYCDKISHIPILIVLENCGEIKTISSRYYYDKNTNNSDKINLPLQLPYKINKSNVKYEFLYNEFNKFGYLQWSYILFNLGWFESHVISFKPLPTNLLGLEELVKQFVDCELSIENWNHFNRLRLVYFSLKNFGYDKTIDQSGWLCLCWNKYKNTIGH